MIDFKALAAEEEAKTKWCPFARYGGVEGQHGNRSYAGSAMEIEIRGGVQCIGSACMAWRWYRTHINNPEGGDLIASTRTHGYCGLAGRWHDGDRP